MKRFFSLALFVACALTLRAAGTVDDSDSSIQNRLLDPSIKHEIICELTELTTVTFPADIAGIEGPKFFRQDPAKPVQIPTDVEFLLSYSEGNRYFSVQPVKPNAKGRLHVVVDGKVLVLRFAVGPKPASSVVFSKDPNAASRQPAPATGGGAPASDSVAIAEVTPARRSVTAASLISLLDRVKASGGTGQLMPGMQRATHNTVTSYPQADITVRDVYRDDTLDIVALECEIKPKGQTPVSYNPDGFSVRVKDADRVYGQVVSDAPGIAQPGRGNIVYVAIKGDGTGARADLDIEKNRFDVLVEFLAAGPTPGPSLMPAGKSVIRPTPSKKKP